MYSDSNSLKTLGFQTFSSAIFNKKFLVPTGRPVILFLETCILSMHYIYQYTQSTHYISMQYLSNASNFSTEPHHIGVHSRYQSFNAGSRYTQRKLGFRLSVVTTFTTFLWN